MRKYYLLYGITILMVAFGCKKRDEYKDQNCSSVNATYQNSIKPIIDRSCTLSGCHDAGSANGNYTTYEGVLARVKNGTLSKRVLYEKDMPRDKPLSLDERKLIKCWIDNGAPER
jgi:hypothetical protein